MCGPLVFYKDYCAFIDGSCYTSKSENSNKVVIYSVLQHNYYIQLNLLTKATQETCQTLPLWTSGSYIDCNLFYIFS